MDGFALSGAWLYFSTRYYAFNVQKDVLSVFSGMTDNAMKIDRRSILASDL